MVLTRLSLCICCCVRCAGPFLIFPCGRPFAARVKKGNSKTGFLHTGALPNLTVWFHTLASSARKDIGDSDITSLTTFIKRWLAFNNTYLCICIYNLIKAQKKLGQRVKIISIWGGVHQLLYARNYSLFVTSYPHFSDGIEFSAKNELNYWILWR